MAFVWRALKGNPLRGLELANEDAWPLAVDRGATQHQDPLCHGNADAAVWDVGGYVRGCEKVCGDSSVFNEVCVCMCVYSNCHEIHILTWEISFSLYVSVALSLSLHLSISAHFSPFLQLTVKNQSFRSCVCLILGEI